MNARRSQSALVLDALPKRFVSKVRVSDNGCWLWTASKLWAGYGQYWDGSTMARAHRFAYAVVNGPVPAGLELDHLCRTRSCVNPDHLEPVTHAENQRRRRINVIDGNDLTRRQRYVLRKKGLI